jgi:hypothetical protein
MTAVTNPEVDSRAYAFVYPIRGREHVPADFPVAIDFDRMVAGIFLPQDQSGWFGKSRYPARILALLPEALVVSTHPSSSEPTVRVRNSDIVAIESGRSLLDGRLTVHTSRASHPCRYNTRDGRHVDKFLFYLRQLTMPEPEGLETTGVPGWFGSPLDLKFVAAEASELDAGERVLVKFFSPPKQSIDNSWFIATHSWRPGDYVGLTSRRIIWITDRSDGHRSVYGTTSAYAGLRRLSEISLAPGDGEGGCELVLSLVGHQGWRVPVPPELREQARLFVDQAHSRGSR